MYRGRLRVIRPVSNMLATGFIPRTVRARPRPTDPRNTSLALRANVNGPFVTASTLSRLYTSRPNYALLDRLRHGISVHWSHLRARPVAESRAPRIFWYPSSQANEGSIRIVTGRRGSTTGRTMQPPDYKDLTEWQQAGYMVPIRALGLALGATMQRARAPPAPPEATRCGVLTECSVDTFPRHRIRCPCHVSVCSGLFVSKNATVCGPVCLEPIKIVPVLSSLLCIYCRSTALSVDRSFAVACGLCSIISG